jgi:hypothetical protein
MARKVTHMSLEGGVLFFEDGTEVSGISVEMIKAAPDLLRELRTAETTLRWAVQESAGRVKAEIRGGWLHHATQACSVIHKATGETIK